jgi:hypothetical protein
MGGKMIKDKGNNTSKFEDVGVVNQRREKRLRKNARNNTKDENE